MRPGRAFRRGVGGRIIPPAYRVNFGFQRTFIPTTMIAPSLRGGPRLEQSGMPDWLTVARIHDGLYHAVESLSRAYCKKFHIYFRRTWWLSEWQVFNLLMYARLACSGLRTRIATAPSPWRVSGCVEVERELCRRSDPAAVPPRSGISPLRSAAIPQVE